MGTDRSELPEGDEKVRVVRAMFDDIAPRYDLVNRIITLRLDTRWRRLAVRDLGLSPRSLVADLACGTGDFCLDLEAADLRPIGYDLSFGMLNAARTKAPLVHGDILRLPVPDAALDGVTCGFALRNLVELGEFYRELGRVLRSGGRIALLDVAEPTNPILRWGHGLYFGKIVPRLGGLLSDRSAYEYLPKSVAYLPEPEQMVNALGDAGFDDVERRLLRPGAAQLFTATKR
ncbi:MAG: ubiquinone/menaquinone biosynthesis methyltransferase [Acidimicrobiales bacterium]